MDRNNPIGRRERFEILKILQDPGEGVVGINENDTLEDVGGVDLVFDVLGGDIAKRSARVIRAGGTLVTIAGPTEARPADGRTVDFVVVPDRAQLSEIVRRARDGRLRTNIGTVSTLDEAVAAFNSTERRKGKTIIRVRP
jgi:NADPH:quinone reductase-like Zn-dependent oxidoreductase